MRKHLFVLAMLLAAPSAQAAGFYVGTHDARATGMATAMTADVADPSAALYNPAGLAQGPGLHVRLGDTLVIPAFTVKLSRGDNTTKQIPVPPPHFYVSYGLSEDASVGLGFFVPFGLALEWSENWQGRYQSTHGSMLNYFINPEVAYRLMQRVRVGAGVQIVRSTLDLNKAISLLDSDATLQIGGSAWGVGGNLGLQVTVLEKSSGFGQLNFGAAYRSTVTLAYRDARAHFDGVTPEFASQLKDQSVSSSLTLPQILAMGLAWQYGGLRLGLDVEYTGWQSVGEMKMEFADPALSTTIAKRYHHTWNVHLGGELAVHEYVRVRLGAMYDPTPSPKETLSPDLPDATRIGLAAGVGLRISGFEADLGYQRVIMLDTESTYAPLPGTYGGSADVVGLTLGYRL